MFTALFVLCSLAVARAATVVCVDGDAGQDGPACGVPPSPCCATLRHAIHNITNHSPHANSTVVMAPGVYGPTSCDITVTQSVSVVGAGRDATVINCASTARVMQVFSPLVSLSLSGLTLSHGQVDDRWVGGPSGGCVLVRWDWDGSGVAEGARGLVAPAVSLEGVRLSHCYAGSDELDWVVGGGLGVILTGAVETAGAWVSVADSVFESNVANSRSGSDAIGGGFGLLLNSTELTAGLQVWLVGNDFRHNAADAANSVNDDGGGIGLYNYALGEVRDANMVVDRYFAVDNFGGALVIEIDGSAYSGNMTITNSEMWNHTDLGPGAGLYFEYSGNIVAWASILIRNCTFSGNTALGNVQAGENVDVVFLEASGNVTQSSLNAFQGGGIWVYVNAITYTGTILMEDCIVTNNTAQDGSAGGVFFGFADTEAVSGSVVLAGNYIADNVAAADGGGVVLWGQGGNIGLNVGEYDEYRRWAYNGSFLLINNTIINNAATQYGNGGGVAILNGACVTIATTLIASNTASLYGGGVYLDSSPNAVAFTDGCELRDNHLPVGVGQQFASFAGGAVGFGGLTVHMSSGSLSQVLVQGGGNVTVSEQTLFQCPPGFLFQDVYGGLYGSSSSLMSEGGWDNPMLSSTLLFSCLSCPPGMYTLSGGHSTGRLGGPVNPTCHSCPFGGVCTSGEGVVAAGGFWGSVVSVGNKSSSHGGVSAIVAAERRVEFTQCPAGYCCDGASVACDSVAVCGGHRVGQLCGECAEGYGEVLGSGSCRLVSQCDDGGYLWPLLVLGLLCVSGGVLWNSGTWCPRPTRHTAALKLVSCFYQTIPLVFAPAYPSVLAAAVEYALTLVRFQAPTSLSAAASSGVCLVPGLSLPGKVAFGYLVPVLLGVGLAAWFAVSKIPCWRRVLQDKQRQSGRARAPVTAKVYPDVDESLSRAQLSWIGVPAFSESQDSVPAEAQDAVASGGDSVSPDSQAEAEEEQWQPEPLAGSVTVARTRSGSTDPLCTTSATVGAVALGTIAPTASQSSKYFVSRRSGSGRAACKGQCSDSDAAAVTGPAPSGTESSGHTAQAGREQQGNWSSLAAHWLLLTHTPLVATSLQLVWCVHLPGVTESVLLLDGNIECARARWFPLVCALLTALVGLAVGMPFWMRHQHKLQGARPSAVYVCLAAGYRDECYWWDSVLLLQRLVLCLLGHALAHAPKVHMLLVGLLCLSVLFAHLYFRPVRHPSAGILQHTLQLCVVVLLMIGTVTASKPVSTAQVVTSRAPAASVTSKQLAEVLGLMFAYAVPCAAVLWHVLWATRGPRCETTPPPKLLKQGSN